MFKTGSQLEKRSRSPLLLSRRETHKIKERRLIKKSLPMIRTFDQLWSYSEKITCFQTMFIEEDQKFIKYLHISVNVYTTAELRMYVGNWPADDEKRKSFAFWDF